MPIKASLYTAVSAIGKKILSTSFSRDKAAAEEIQSEEKKERTKKKAR